MSYFLTLIKNKAAIVLLQWKITANRRLRTYVPILFCSNNLQSRILLERERERERAILSIFNSVSQLLFLCVVVCSCHCIQGEMNVPCYSNMSMCMQTRSLYVIFSHDVKMLKDNGIDQKGAYTST